MLQRHDQMMILSGYDFDQRIFVAQSLQFPSCFLFWQYYFVSFFAKIGRGLFERDIFVLENRLT